MINFGQSGCLAQSLPISSWIYTDQEIQFYHPICVSKSELNITAQNEANHELLWSAVWTGYVNITQDIGTYLK